MRKLIAIVLLCAPTVLSSAQAAEDVFGDISRTAPRGAIVAPSDFVARDPFDRINDTAPVRQPSPREDIYPGE